MEKLSFYEWYNKTSEKAGSLITPASATKMIGCSRQYLEKLAQQGRITKHYYDNLPFIGMNEINELIARKRKRIEEENNKSILYNKVREEELIEKIRNIQNQKRQNQQAPEEEERQQEYLEYLEKILAEEESSDELTDFNPPLK